MRHGVSTPIFSALCGAFAFCLTGFTCADAKDASTKFQMTLGSDAKPLTVFAGDPSLTVEAHAAKELVKYLNGSTGVKCVIASSDQEMPASGDVILLGDSASNPLIKRLEERGLLKTPSKGGDGFIIKTALCDGRSFLVLSGASSRGSLYAVYDFCERFLGTGFFWEGDRMRECGSLPLGAVDVKETPYFNMRVYMQECPFTYSTAAWTIEDWIKEMDWMSKKRLNALMVPTDNWNYRVAMKDIVKEAKKRGISPVLGGECDRFDLVSADFMKGNPGHKYVKMRWWEDAPYWCLSPEDPLFLERCRERIRSQVKAFGEGNIYFLSPYGEQSMLDKTEGEILKIRMAFADAVQKAVKEEDPKGVWMYWTWPFIAPVWPQRDVKEFVGRMAPDNAFVCDSSQPEIKGDYHYKRYGHFYGKRWLLSFIHLYGGDDYLAGDLAGVIKDVKTVIADPAAGNCAGVYICPELIHYNTICFDLLAKLAWNPKEVDLAAFTKSYLLGRYGKESYDGMKRTMDILQACVYGSKGSADALYQHRPVCGSDSKMLDLLAISKQIYKDNNVAALKKAIECAFAESRRQKDNPLYRRDIVDMTRQYISDLFNQSYLKMPSRKLPERLRADIDDLRFLLDRQQELLAAYPPYQMRPVLSRSKDSPRYKDMCRMMKDATLTFASKEWLIDYSSKDILELLKYYYRPRMEAYFASLEKGDGGKDLAKTFRKIENAWLDMDILSLPASDYADGADVVDTASRIFAMVNARFGDAAAERTDAANGDFLYREGPAAVADVAWEARFKEPAMWSKAFFKGGRMICDGDAATMETENNEGSVFETKLDLNVKENPYLSFKMTSSGHLTVIWIEWTDAFGKTRRNRVWQEPAQPHQWKEATINLEKILEVVAVPAKITKLQIENVANSWSRWEFIRIGSLKKADGGKAAPRPVAFYPLDEGKGDVARDASGGRNDGKAFACQWVGDGGAGCLHLNGKTSYVRIPHKDYLNFKDKFSVSAWVYPRSPYGARGIVSKGRGSYSGYNFEIVNKRLCLDCYLESGGRKTMERFLSDEIIAGDAWSHVGLVFDGKGAGVAFYLNGELVSSRKASGAICYAPPLGDFKYAELPLCISGISTFPQIHCQFDGFMRDVRLYDQALSAADFRREFAEGRKLTAFAPQTDADRRLKCEGVPVHCETLDRGVATTCKVFLRDSNGGFRAPAGSFSYGTERKMEFYSSGTFDMKLLPGRYKAVFLKGFEYEPLTVDFEVEAGAKSKALTAELVRWVDLPSMGWYCGDEEVQIDGHTEKPYDMLLTGKNVGDAYRIAAAEGLNWANIVTGMDAKEARIGDSFLAGNGREVNSRMIGDIICLNEIMGQGGLFGQLKTIDKMNELGGAVTFAEEYSTVEPVLREGARGVPVAVALGKCRLWRHAFDEKPEPIGYRFLNLGFKMAPSGGSDVYMNNPATLIEPGFNRVYAHLGALTWKEIVSAYKRQDLFTTYGPYAFMTANGVGLGGTVELPDRGGVLTVSLNAGHCYGIRKLELIKDGRTVKEIVPSKSERRMSLSFDINVDSSCWIALKCVGSRGEYFGSWAHTAPIYVQVGDSPMTPRDEDVKFFIDWIDKLKSSITELSAKERWSPATYKPYLQNMDDAKAVFAGLKASPRNWRLP